MDPKTESVMTALDAYLDAKIDLWGVEQDISDENIGRIVRARKTLDAARGQIAIALAAFNAAPRMP